jgi:diguanylate cyclase (GGDEF)-like protein
VAVVVLAFAGGALLPVLGADVRHEPSFAPAVASAVVLCDVLTAVLLAQQFAARGGARPLLLAIAYLVTGLAVLGDGVLGGAPASSWLWAAAHVALPVGLIAALSGGARSARRRLADPALRRARTALVALAASAAAAVALWPVAAALPHVSEAALGPFVGALAAAAIVVVARRGRRGDHERWLLLVAAGTFAAAVLTGLAAPGTVGWYAAHLLDVLTAAVLLMTLIADVGGLHRRLEDIHETLRAEGAIDPLTAMPSRAAALAMAAGIERIRPHDAALAVAVVDVDRLAAVNDAYGRLGGDAALRVVAGRLRDALRDEDLVARDGDDEFVLVLPDTDLNGAALGVERALQAIRASPAWGGPRQITLTASAGVVLVGRGDGALSAALEQAAGALAHAKALGRDRVVAGGELSPGAPAPEPLRPGVAAPQVA